MRYFFFFIIVVGLAMRALLPCWAINADVLNGACAAATLQVALAMNDLAIPSDGNDTLKQYQNKISAVCT